LSAKALQEKITDFEARERQLKLDKERLTNNLLEMQRKLQEEQDLNWLKKLLRFLSAGVLFSNSKC
jgi:hypothetical protein